MNRSRGKQQKRISKKKLVTHKQLTKQSEGTQVRTRNDPPATQLVPWNSIVLVVNTNTASAAPTSQFYSSATIDVALRSQLGIEDLNTPELAIRVDRISVWARPVLTSTDSNIVQLGPCDLLSTSGVTQELTVVRKWLEDRGTNVRPAAVSFIWPSSDRAVVYHTSQDERTVWVNRISNVAQRYIVHLHILWRVYSYPDVSLSRGLLTTGNQEANEAVSETGHDHDWLAEALEVVSLSEVPDIP